MSGRSNRRNGRRHSRRRHNRHGAWRLRLRLGGRNVELHGVAWLDEREGNGRIRWRGYCVADRVGATLVEAKAVVGIGGVKFA